LTVMVVAFSDVMIPRLVRVGALEYEQAYDFDPCFFLSTT
jgi:hypothetical protein